MPAGPAGACSSQRAPVLVAEPDADQSLRPKKRTDVIPHSNASCCLTKVVIIIRLYKRSYHRHHHNQDHRDFTITIRNDIPLPEQLPPCLQPVNLRGAVIARHTHQVRRRSSDLLYIFDQKPPMGDHQPEAEVRREEGGDEVKNQKNSTVPQCT